MGAYTGLGMYIKKEKKKKKGPKGNRQGNIMPHTGLFQDFLISMNTLLSIYIYVVSMLDLKYFMLNSGC